MKRKLAVGVVAVVLLAGLALVLLGLSLNRTLAANREAILSRVQTAIGRPLRVDEISVSWRAGLGVRLTQVELGEAPDFGNDPFVRAPEVTLHLRFGPLLARRFELGGVTFTEPIIRVVRAADGRRNYESLGSHPTRPVDEPAAPAPTAAVISTAALALVVDSVTIHAGTLIFVDRSISPPADTTLRQIDATLRDIGRERAIAFGLAVAVAGGQQNIYLTGELGPAGPAGQWPVHARGTAGPFPALRATIEDLEAQAVLTPTVAELASLRGRALGGSFDLSGSCGLDANAVLRLAGTLRQISLAQLLVLRSERPPIAIDGTGALRLDLHGPLGPNLLRTLSGRMTLEAEHGTVRQFNAASELIEHVVRLPGLSRNLSGRLKPKYGRLFTAPDTRFEHAAATLVVADGRASTDDLTLTAEDFGIRAAGWFDIDHHIDLTGTLAMSKRFSDDLTADVKEVKYIVDDNGQLAVPFRMRGKIGEAKPAADTGALARTLDRAISRGAATDLLGRLFGGKRRRDKTDKTPEATNSDDAQQRILRDLLGH